MIPEGIREVEAIYGDEKAVRRRVDQGYQLLATHFQAPSKAGEDGVVVYVVGRTTAARDARAAANAERKAERKKNGGEKKTTAKKTTAKSTAKKTTAKKG